MPLDVAAAGAALPGREIHWRASLDSTMYDAAKLAAAGAPSGTVVGADEQTAGMGRFGRRWHSEPDAGLYFSVVLRPIENRPQVGNLPHITLALGLAVREAIVDSTGVVCDLRWPNDLLIGDRKCAGILTQLDDRAVIAGIGINVNQSAFPADLSEIATSLRLASGRSHSREELLIRLLPAIDEWSALDSPSILRVFAESSSYVRGRRVAVEIAEDDLLTGTTAGLTSDGYLIVRDDRGKEHTIIAGGVRPA